MSAPQTPAEAFALIAQLRDALTAARQFVEAERDALVEGATYGDGNIDAESQPYIDESNELLGVIESALERSKP